MREKPEHGQWLIYAAAVPLCLTAVLRSVGWLTRTVAPGLSEDVRRIITELLTALPVSLVFRKSVRRGGRRSLTVSRFLFCFLCLGLPLLFRAGINVCGGRLQSGFSGVLSAVLGGFSVGLCEELVFRGVVFNRLRDLLPGGNGSVVRAALLSSCVFALTHLFNLPEQTPAGMAMQVFFTFALGLFCCGTYLFSGTLLVPVLHHGITDAGAFLLTSGSVPAASVSPEQIGFSALILAEGLTLVLLYRKRVL